MVFGQVEVKAPQLLPGLVHTNNPRFHENIFIAELAHFFKDSSLYCIKTRRGNLNLKKCFSSSNGLEVMMLIRGFLITLDTATTAIQLVAVSECSNCIF